MATASSGWRAVLALSFRPRLLTVAGLGFSSGLPFPLVYMTLSAWLAESGVSRTEIGLFSLAATAYSLKYLWSPLVDHVRIPLLGRLGRRRSWMLVAQAAVALSIVGLSRTDPSTNLAATALWAVILAFASATQDIVVDAYRVELLDEAELGAGAANVVFGYRISWLISGAGCLVLADLFGWQVAIAAMAGAVAVGVVTVLVSPEPKPRSAPAALAPVVGGPAVVRAIGWLREAIVSPFADFLRRPGWAIVLAFVLFYKYGDYLVNVMSNPFYIDLGFSKTEIGLVSKVWGLAATLTGVFLGGLLVAKVGLLRALLVGGVLQALSNLVYVALALSGPSLPVLTLTIAVENLAGGLGTAAFVAYLSSLCSVAYTATQYALLTAFSAIARQVFASVGGWAADRVDWVVFFVLTSIAALPGLALLLVMIRRFPTAGRPGQVLAEPD
jgi:PAT family beta-lactamase induction signal transducer AmpG